MSYMTSETPIASRFRARLMSSSMKVKRRLFSAAEDEDKDEDGESSLPLGCLFFLRVRFSGAETADARTTTETVSFGWWNFEGKEGSEVKERKRVDIWSA